MSKSIIKNIDKQKLEEALDNSYNLTSALEYLGYETPRGKMYKILRQRFEFFGIDYSKLENGKNPNATKRYSDEEVFNANSKVSQETLRKRFLQRQHQDFRCQICGISSWQGKPLTLRLDHINGKRTDNRIENLRWVCPNCDSQLETYCGRNVKTKRKIHHCIDCGKKLSSASKNPQRCPKCSKIQKRKIKERPLKETLYRQLCEHSFIEVGKLYGVSDNAIRKWCRSYGIPDKASYYKKL